MRNVPLLLSLTGLQRFSKRKRSKSNIVESRDIVGLPHSQLNTTGFMSKSLDGSISNIPRPIRNEVDTNEPSLSELSEQDKPWDKHRHSADRVADHYRGEVEFDRYAQRMDFCSQLLEFKLVPHDKEDSLRFKLAGARFCRVRHCPVCQWRRSLKWKARALEALPKIIKDFPKHRWLFLTLTQKNCPVTELRETITEMNKSFKRLTRFKEWCIDGWIKSLEVTHGKDGKAHPHFHLLLICPPSYFSNNYISQQKWVELWQKAAKLDYKPQVHIKAVHKKQNPAILIPEILKYSLKESDLYRDKDFLFEVTRQLHKTRCVSVGGVLKSYLKKVGEEPEDLIGDDETEVAEEIARLYFGWRYQEKKYRLKT